MDPAHRLNTQWTVSSHRLTAGIGLLLFVAFFALLLCPRPATATTHPYPLVITGDVDYPPSSWEENGTLAGAAIDMLKLALEELGVPYIVRSKGPWKRAQASIKYGDADAITSVYRTAEREKYAVYVDEPYLIEKNVIWLMKGSTFQFSNWRDLKNRRAGLLLGNSYGSTWDTLFKKKLPSETVHTMLSNLKKLEDRRIDYIPFAFYPGTILVKKYNYQDRVTYLPTPLNSVGLHIAFSKKSKFLDLIPALNELIIRYKEDGTMDRLIQESLDRYLDTHTVR